jgi:hypothetical protein
MDVKCLPFFLDVIVMNEIKENNYAVNVLWKWNIACLWVPENDIVSMIEGDPNFSLPWDRFP